MREEVASRAAHGERRKPAAGVRRVAWKPAAARVSPRVLRAVGEKVGEKRAGARHHAACTSKSWMGAERAAAPRGRR